MNPLPTTDPCSCATYGFHEPALPGEPDPACPVHGGEVSMKGMANTAPYSDQWVDCTDNAVIDIAAKGSRDDDSYWPTMIQLDFYEDGCTVISSDARRLAEMLVRAADSADAIDNARFATDSTGGTDGR